MGIMGHVVFAQIQSSTFTFNHTESITMKNLSVFTYNDLVGSMSEIEKKKEIVTQGVIFCLFKMPSENPKYL